MIINIEYKKRAINVINNIFMVLMTLFTSTSFAASYNFVQDSFIEENIASQLTMDVTQSGDDVLFTFYNDASENISSSLTDIYFSDSDALFTDVSVYADSGEGVAFTNGAKPSSYKGDSKSSFTTDYSADSDSPVSDNGVSTSSEWVSFLGTLDDLNTYSMVLDSLTSGDFLVGLHIQSINGGSSDWYLSTSVSSISAVPLPAAAWLFGSALIGFVSVQSRRKV